MQGYLGFLQDIVGHGWCLIQLHLKHSCFSSSGLCIRKYSLRCVIGLPNRISICHSRKCHRKNFRTGCSVINLFLQLCVRYCQSSRNNLECSGNFTSLRLILIDSLDLIGSHLLWNVITPFLACIGPVLVGPVCGTVRRTVPDTSLW